MKHVSLVILSLLLTGCFNDRQSVSYRDYKADQKIAVSLDKTNDCETKLKLAKQLKTIDFLKRKARIFDNCGGPIINDEIENADEKVIDQLELIFKKDQEVRNQIQDSLGADYTFDRLVYYVKKYEDKTDTLSLMRFEKVVDSIGEWPGVKYVPTGPWYPKTEILVAHFPEKSYVKYVNKAIDAAHHNKEYWRKAKLMVEYSLTKPCRKPWEQKQEYIFPFRFIEFRKNGKIDEKSEMTVLDFENLSNRQFVHSGCPSPKFRLSSSLSQQKGRIKLLEQARAILLKQGLKEDDIVLDFSKQEDDMNYKLFFEELCS